MSRSVAEWIGKTDDSKIPASVRLRIFRNAGGVCHITGVVIKSGQQWDAEHVVPLSMGGSHRESNLRPALKAAHKEKTSQEAEVRAKADAVAKKHLGIEPPKAKIQSAGFAKSQAKESRKSARKEMFAMFPRGMTQLERMAQCTE